MSERERILVVVGTRPEAIKMAPVVLRLQREPERFETVVCATAQHREMLDAVLELFGIRPEVDLDLMRPNQTLNEIAARVLDRFDHVVDERSPSWILVQGDTTTVMAASLVAFHRGIRLGHVEAGLRTHSLRNPFPEEMNRRVTDLVSTAHFAPTTRSALALSDEGAPSSSVYLTGNTVVDALRWIAEREPEPAESGRLVLITSHRRESFGAPMERSFRAIRRLAERFQDHQFIFPVHPNPNVRAAARALEGLPNLRLVEPAGYAQLVAWMRAARIVITDSGGIQEEAPTFGKPTLVLRDTTERPEGIDAGVALLVGTDEERIYDEASRLLLDETAYQSMAQARNPYGDGRAAERIVDVLAGRVMVPFVSTAPEAAHP